MSIQKVQFEVEGCQVVGELHLPKEQAAPAPAVVVGGPMTSVKEQVTGTYAKAMASRGIAALAIDHRHYGESEGQPRQYEYFKHKIEDLQKAAEFLASRDDIDASRIGAVGVCLGCGYIAHAFAGHEHVKALGLIAGYYRDVPAMMEADPEGFKAQVEQGIKAREEYEKTNVAETIPACATCPPEKDAAMKMQYLVDYYCNKERAAVPNYKNLFAVMSREHFVPFDVQNKAKEINKPVVMIHGEKAIGPPMAKKFFENITYQDKEIHWQEANNQTDFYDNPEIVDTNADVLKDFMQANL